MSRNKESPKPVFIGGTGRSGTTILAKLLGKHSKLFRFPLEARFLIDPDGLVDLIPALSKQWSPYVGSKAIGRFRKLMDNIGSAPNIYQKYEASIFNKLNFYKTISPGNGYTRAVNLPDLVGKDFYQATVDSFLQELIEEEFQGYWVGTNPYTIKPKIISPKIFTYEELIQKSSLFARALLSKPFDREEISLWVESTPFNICHADFLRELFPDMRIIHIHRDPRDVISSYITKSWGGNDPEDVLQWIKGVFLRWEKQKKELPKYVFSEVKLETLLERPEKTLNSIFDWLEEDFEDRVLDLDLSRGHTGRWREDLARSEAEKIENELNEVYDFS